MATVNINSDTWYVDTWYNVNCSASSSKVAFNNGFDYESGAQSFSKACIKVANIENYSKITLVVSSVVDGSWDTYWGIWNVNFGIYNNYSSSNYYDSTAPSGLITQTELSTSSSSKTYTLTVPSGTSGTKYVGFCYYDNSTNSNGCCNYATINISSIKATEGSFTITANIGAGISSVSPISQSILSGSSSEPITATVAPGYYWGYWSDGETENPYPSFTVTAAKSLTAYGYGNSYKIYYNGNGHTSGSMSYSSHIYGTTKTLTINSYKKIGYTFIGWNTLANGNGTSYSDAQSITTWSPIPNHNSSITLYAQWRPNIYEIQYNSNWPGDSSLGTGTMENSFHTYDVEDTLSLNLYDYHRKRFLNWNTKADGSGTTYLNGQTIKNLTSIDNDIFNLYAIWIPDGTARIEINNVSKMAQAYIYYNGKWRLTTPYTYHNEKWKLNGG